jgi:MoaA/NifB/PqqE/SkfB family radical SAM enzyme
MDNRQHLESIELEISTKCPIKCPACPRTYKPKNAGWNTGFMDLDVLKSLVNDTLYRNYIFCGAYGDAIYHPKITEVIEFMLSTNKRFMIETNGSYIKPETWQSIADLPWQKWHTRRSKFIFSIDGLEDTNHIYRKNSDWKSIMAGIEILSGIENGPELEWKYLVFPYNEHQVEDARKLSVELGFNTFTPFKSLREYQSNWFVDAEERSQIDW